MENGEVLGEIAFAVPDWSSFAGVFSQGKTIPKSFGFEAAT